MESETVGMVIASVLLLSLLSIIVIDMTYKYPQAAEKANQICQEQGYDFYETYQRIGILSNEPVAIKCKYVDNYKEIDMKLRRISEE